jgi:hypothetical protein
MEEYRVLEIDVIRFEAEDVITASPNGGDPWEIPEIPAS